MKNMGWACSDLDVNQDTKSRMQLTHNKPRSKPSMWLDKLQKKCGQLVTGISFC